MNKSGTGVKGTAVGSVFAGLLAVSCCVGPALLALLGVSSLGIFAVIGRYHTLLVGITVLLLGTGFYFAYRKQPECGEECALPANRKRDRIIVWIAAVLVTISLGFPYVKPLIFK